MLQCGLINLWKIFSAVLSLWTIILRIKKHIVEVLRERERWLAWGSIIFDHFYRLTEFFGTKCFKCFTQNEKGIHSLIESLMVLKNNEQWCWLSIKIEFSRKSLTYNPHPIRNSRKEFFSDSQRKKFDYRSFFLLQARKQTFMSTVTKFKFFFPSSTILQHSLFLLYI